MAEQPISTPGDVIALIPGLLGFYPEESLVVMCFNHNPQEGYATTGPVMRMGIDDVSESAFDERFTQLTNGYNCVCAVLVTQRRSCEVALKALDHLYVAYMDDKLDVIWSVNEVAEGERYMLEYGQQPLHVDDPRFYEGDVSSIVASPAMAQLAQHGMLPELTREDMVSYFAHNPRHTRTYAEIARDAYKLGDDALEAWADGTRDPARALIAQAMLAIETAQPDVLVASEVPEALELTSIDELTALIACLSTSKLRDGLITVVLANPERASQLLLSITQQFYGVVRANALCLWAMLATQQSLYGLARAAIDEAEATVPGHRLTKLVQRCVHHGMHAELLRNAADGSHATLTEVGL